MFELSSVSIALAIYAAGVLVGLATMRDRWPTRLAVALVWPLGPAAFLVVVTIMVIAAAVLWPLMVAGVAAVAAAIAWLS